MNIKDFILGYLIGKGDGGSSVEVEPLSVTENGEYSEEGVAYSPVTVDVPTGGGASNFKTGTFKGDVGDTNIIVDIDTGYTGNGYPIAGIICVDGGVYNPSNTDWYNLNKSGNVGLYAFTKAAFDTTPAYNGGSNDGASTYYAYKYGSATDYQRGGNINNSIYKQANPSNSLANTLAIKDKSTIRCYVNQTADYGFAAGVTYRYWIIYSE